LMPLIVIVRTLYCICQALPALLELFRVCDSIGGRLPNSYMGIHVDSFMSGQASAGSVTDLIV